MTIPGRGLSFVVERTYRSRMTYDGPFGHGWSFSYDDGLEVQPSGDVMRGDPDNHIDLWRRNANGTFTAPPAYFGTLTQRADGVYVLREPDGLERHYLPTGQLLAHVDRFGNTLTFENDEHGDLDVVVDTYGREIDFDYQTIAGRRRISRIRDFTGREWLYSYDSIGNLTAVRHPLVVGTSTGNDFPSGATERYGYSSHLSHPRLVHNLTTIMAPEESATGGAPWLTIV